METLTLEHLSAYLPYGLKGISKEENLGIETVKGFQIQSVSIELITDFDYLQILDFKPILYPLSSLTNEQIVDLGLIFREIDPHNATLKDKIFAIEDARSWLTGGMKPVMSLGQCQKAMNHLYSIKADIFNLIPKGLAVDVNTLETNPYK